MRRPLLLAAAAATTICLGEAAATAAPRGIHVVGTQEENRGQVLADFDAASCRVDRNGFHGRARSPGGWSLKLRIKPFKGYRRYTLAYGLPARATFHVDPPGAAPSFSNTWTPDGVPLPPVGGAVTFRRGRKIIDIGFPSAFNSLELPATKRVAVLGQASCRYRGKGRR